jgi:hypothetical protein
MTDLLNEKRNLSKRALADTRKSYYHLENQFIKVISAGIVQVLPNFHQRYTVSLAHLKEQV